MSDVVGATEAACDDLAELAADGSAEACEVLRSLLGYVATLVAIGEELTPRSVFERGFCNAASDTDWAALLRSVDAADSVSSPSRKVSS